MVDPDLAVFAQEFGAEHDPHVECILYYPHPLTRGGLILVFADGVDDLIDLIGEAHQKVPSDYTLYCLRHRELAQLSLPGIFAPPFSVNERPHLPYFLQHKGAVLYGQDCRQAIQPTAVPSALLAGHIEGCRDSLRRYGILPALLCEKYEKVATMLEQEVLHLMSTALLLHDQWDIRAATLPETFSQYFPDEQLTGVWQQLREHQKGLDENPAESAYHMVWLFEGFLRRLESYVS
jgi:hypothetical protein